MTSTNRQKSKALNIYHRCSATTWWLNRTFSLHLSSNSLSSLMVCPWLMLHTKFMSGLQGKCTIETTAIFYLSHHSKMITSSTTDTTTATVWSYSWTAYCSVLLYQLFLSLVSFTSISSTCVINTTLYSLTIRATLTAEERSGREWTTFKCST